ncbi:TetR/AcrR family transcriptional regulator [Nocardia sp. 2]|uniref:TetR/AcrR family transcriptional regulator n=1 Tax=Nocardia acididurans TaxID=2802282 RepID=A0ABS1MHU9_9NOCA|nr:TetR family transcriptional regulator [Nocardia acididurans]MBL1079630.1 TetR/AcrR family transcriptional regulator [Nocardia acididurans]
MRLVDAGIAITGTEGVAGLGMRAVCREAGLSQKFFYESFTDIDELLHAVYAATLARLEEEIGPAVSARDLPGVFDAAARLMEADPRVCRILLIEPVADARLRRHVRDTIPAITIAALGDLAAGSPADPAVRMRFSALFGALISLFVEWTEGSLGSDRAAFVRHVCGVATQLVPQLGVRPR